MCHILIWHDYCCTTLWSYLNQTKTGLAKVSIEASQFQVLLILFKSISIPLVASRFLVILVFEFSILFSEKMIIPYSTQLTCALKENGRTRQVSVLITIHTNLVDAVVETDLVSSLQVSLFPEIIFTKAGNTLYREKGNASKPPNRSKPESLLASCCT